MNFSDFDSVVSKEVMPDKLKVLRSGEESQHFSIIVQELLLGRYSSSSKFLLQELEELWVLLWWNWLLRDSEAVLWA